MKIEEKVERKIVHLIRLNERLSIFRGIIQRLFGDVLKKGISYDARESNRIVLCGYKLIFQTWFHIPKFGITERIIAECPLQAKDEARGFEEWREPRSYFTKALIIVLEEELGWDRYTIPTCCEKCGETIVRDYGVYNHDIPMYIWTAEYYPCNCKTLYPKAKPIG